MKVNTINVVGMDNGTLLYIRSYKDNKKGNAQAEASFKHLIRNKEGRTPDPEELKVMLDDGYYTDLLGYQLFLAHSV